MIEAGRVGGVVAVALELQVQRGRHGGGADVGQVVAHIDIVATAMQRERLGDLHAARFAFECDDQVVAGQLALGGDEAERRLVRGEALAVGRANDTGLHDVVQAGGAVQQHRGLVRLAGGRVLQKLGAHELGAHRVERQAQNVGRDDDLFRARGSGRGGAGNGGRRSSCCRSGRAGHRGRRVVRGSLRFARAGRGRGAPEQRRLAVMDLPVVP
ncbi:hypothetical protein D9M68_553280 [compost metagenome]